MHCQQLVSVREISDDAGNDDGAMAFYSYNRSTTVSHCQQPVRVSKISDSEAMILGSRDGIN